MKGLGMTRPRGQRHWAASHVYFATDSRFCLLRSRYLFGHVYVYVRTVHVYRYGHSYDIHNYGHSRIQQI
jgi:hypothetical protein